MLFAALLVALPILHGCKTTSHAEQPTVLGRRLPSAALDAALGGQGAGRGPVELQAVVSADWVAPLSGLVNLNSPEARAAGLVERDEPIQVYLYRLRHPTLGLFLIDTGFAARMVREPGSLGINPVLRHGMHIDRLRFHRGPADVVRDANEPLRGVFLTHLHLDHIGGLSEVPIDVPIYAGPGETTETHWKYAFTQGAVDRAFRDRPPLQTWAFGGVADRPETGGTAAVPAALDVVDIFGDGSVFALGVPGHTQGSTAYLVRSTTGPVLVVGDTSHTRWGWEHAVEPGDFTLQGARNRQSLRLLKALVARHPAIEVRVGHQP